MSAIQTPSERRGGEWKPKFNLGQIYLKLLQEAEDKETKN